MFTSTVVKALVGLLTLAPAATATWTNSCRNACLQGNNMLVTECSVEGGNALPSDNYQWAEFDLNKLLGYRSPTFLTYTENGDFSVNSLPCGLCTLSGSTVSCTCLGGNASIDLNTYIEDVTGLLCYGGPNFGPLCGPATTRRC